MFVIIWSMDRELLEDLLGAGLSLEAIGERVGRHASTVGYWVAKHGLEAAHKDTHAARGKPDEVGLRELVAAGLSIRAIAQRLGVSYTTARYWLRHYDMHTLRSDRRRRIDQAGNSEPRRIELVCSTHGPGEFVREGRGYFRCARCRAERVAQRRREVKEQLVAEAGGCCAVCGFDRTPSALHFHHLDPKEKSFAIGSRGVTRGLGRARAEAAKCVLLCANCHAEVEAGVIRLL